ncbi:MAG: hypothetical protein IT422_26225 [Pirellulaceae bacterium]|jgi:hypothetical protein|nr:hypothetical protein [Pirellulaceae bacterium]
MFTRLQRPILVSLITCVAWLGICVGLPAQQNNAPATPDIHSSAANGPITQHKQLRDLPYATVDGHELKLDLYIPEGVTEPRQAAIDFLRENLPKP